MAGGFLASTKGGFVSARGGGGATLSFVDEANLLTTGATSISVVGAALTATTSNNAITITQGSWSTGSVIGGATMTLGSDATGDTYYRAASGVLTRLGVGSNTNVLTLAGGVPSWAAPAGGGGSVAGSDGQLQYNNYDSNSNTSAFGGAAQLHYDDSNTNLGIGTSTFNASAVKTLALGNGTAPAAPTANQCSIYARDTTACVLLLHMNGANDGTTFTDDSPSAHSITAGGTAHTDTAIKKYGAASYQGDGVNGTQLTLPTSSDWQFGLNDFTIEFWFHPLDLLSYQMLLSQYAPVVSWEFRLNAAGNKVEFLYAGSTSFKTAAATIVVDTWNHVAWSRQGSYSKIFLNGVGSALVTNTTNYVQDQPISVGSRPNGTYSLNGYIDDVKIMNGEGLYFEDFTPPTGEMSGDTSEIYTLDELGNETQISPHNTQNEWVFQSKNRNTGRNVKVNMERMIKRLEELHPGEKFLEEWNE